jgi:hypothetical protein
MDLREELTMRKRSREMSPSSVTNHDRAPSLGSDRPSVTPRPDEVLAFVRADGNVEVPRVGLNGCIPLKAVSRSEGAVPLLADDELRSPVLGYPVHPGR